MRTNLCLTVASAFALACSIVCTTRLNSAAPDQEQPASQQTAGRELVRALGQSRLVDLTHAFDEKTIYWPTEKGFVLEKGPAGLTPKGYFYSANRFAAAEHGGTHLDAPIHFFEGRRTVEAIPLAQLVGEGAVVDVSGKCADNADYEIGVGDLRAWETQHRRQLVDMIVLLKTGYGRRWPERKRYLGTDALGPQAVAELHFPGLAPEAARWLTLERHIKAVGIDTASIDYGQSAHFQSHVRLFGATSRRWRTWPTSSYCPRGRSP